MGEPVKHALLSPSGSSKWLKCPGSIYLESEMERTNPSFFEAKDYTDEGTCAHLLLNIALSLFMQGRISVQDAVIQASITAEIRDNKHLCGDMVEYTISTIHQILAIYDPVPGQFKSLYLENGVSMFPGCFGTADIIIIKEQPGTPYIHVIDYKYGEGVKVSAEKNSQLLLYAYGAIKAYMPKYIEHSWPLDIYITVLQPRMCNTETYTVCLPDLLYTVEDYKEKALKALTDQGKTFEMGDHCTFCKGKVVCPKFNSELQIFADFNEQPFTNEMLTQILQRAEKVTGFISRVKELAKSRILSGEDVPGYKVVQGTSKRSYASTVEVLKTIQGMQLSEEEYFKYVEPICLTALEKKLGKKKFKESFNHLITEVAGPTSLVKSTHPAEAIDCYAEALDNFKHIH